MDINPLFYKQNYNTRTVLLSLLWNDDDIEDDNQEKFDEML